MASFSVDGSEDDLATADDLWALFKELLSQGFRGMVSAGPNGSGVDTFALEAHIDDPDIPTGTRTIKGNVGDKKVVIGDVISVMTQEAFAATYGGN